VLVAQPQRGRAQETPSPTAAQPAEIAVLEARLEETRRSQDQLAGAIASDNGNAMTIAAAMIGLASTIAVVLIGFNIFQGNRNYDRDRAALQREVRDSISDALQETRDHVAAEFKSEATGAVESIRPRVEQLVSQRMAEYYQAMDQQRDTIESTDRDLNALIREVALRTKVNDVRILLSMSGYVFQPEELQSHFSPTVDAIIDLIDFAPNVTTPSDAVQRSFDYLHAYLTIDGVTINAVEQHAIRQRIGRHRSEIGAIKADLLDILSETTHEGT
jgi:hypothetical protein